MKIAEPEGYQQKNKPKEKKLEGNEKIEKFFKKSIEEEVKGDNKKRKKEEAGIKDTVV